MPPFSLILSPLQFSVGSRLHVLLWGRLSWKHLTLYQTWYVFGNKKSLKQDVSGSIEDSAANSRIIVVTRGHNCRWHRRSAESGTPESCSCHRWYSCWQRPFSDPAGRPRFASCHRLHDPDTA